MQLNFQHAAYRRTQKNKKGPVQGVSIFVDQNTDSNPVQRSCGSNLTLHKNSFFNK